MTSRPGKACGASANTRLTTSIFAGQLWKALHRLSCRSEESFGERKRLPCRSLRDTCLWVARMIVVVALEEYYSECKVDHADVCGIVRSGLHERCCHSGGVLHIQVQSSSAPVMSDRQHEIKHEDSHSCPTKAHLGIKQSAL